MIASHFCFYKDTLCMLPVMGRATNILDGAAGFKYIVTTSSLQYSQGGIHASCNHIKTVRCRRTDTR